MLLDAIPLQVLSRTTNGAGDVFGLTPVVRLGVTVEAPTWCTAFTITLTTAKDASSPTPWAIGDLTITQSGITGGTFTAAIDVAGPGVGLLTLSGIAGSSDGTTLKAYVHRDIGARTTGAC